MKKWFVMALAACMLTGLLAGCGSKEEGSAQVDLSAFYETLAEEYHWSEDPQTSQEGDLLMSSVEGELLESYYPGLADVATEQLIVKAPMMSAVVNEVVFAQCKSEDDAASAAEILQSRADAQAEGGAWYPESMEAWGKAKVIQNGTYVAMIASAERQTEIEDAFNALFA
ncbi:DUF4358 domain-containing protein [uncultured Oscillibacter sp.]|uniref:DUF4358 domain-containing protein n=1 Tax=uncultured Oscillibacter sp. TaxID=876091 RepID=UPI00280ACEF2|nr:DUF4358 domain-containing protein [uncultured Oscillibacter sp.]